MNLKIIHNPQDYKIKAENFLSVSFCDDLKNKKPWTYIESLVARYLIKSLSKEWQGAKDPCCKYSSISHKKDLVFIWVSDKKIWVDIEIIKKRDAHLLEKFSNTEYSLLWQTDWNSFYALWTAKEAIIKYENLLLDDIENILLDNVEEYLWNVSWIMFQYKLVFCYNNKQFIVYYWKEKSLAFSVCISSKLW